MFWLPCASSPRCRRHNQHEAALVFGDLTLLRALDL
jgi:hypothetical protein